MNYSIRDIQTIISGDYLHCADDTRVVRNIVFDSRKISFAHYSIFVAISTDSNDGHNYIDEAYQKGIRSFIIENTTKCPSLENVNIILVKNSFSAIQALARHHRKAFDIPVVSITGSNGKTIVKEWLAECLNDKYSCFKSPLSYNSQLGVPLSVLQLEDFHEIAVFEAGISQPDEMDELEKIIQPQYGIMTNIGDAHDSGFESRAQKLDEKLLLFKNCKTIIYCKDHTTIDATLTKRKDLEVLNWGQHPEADYRIIADTRTGSKTTITLKYKRQSVDFSLPFSNRDLIENCMHVICFLLSQNWQQDRIQPLIDRFRTLPNRLEIKEGNQNNILINDSYSLDLASLQSALEYQDQIAGDMRKVIFITAPDQVKDTRAQFDRMMELIIHKEIADLVVIGIVDTPFNPLNSSMKIQSFQNTLDCLEHYDFDKLQNSCVLFKGARKYTLERIFDHLSLQRHQTILETNLNAVSRNIKSYRQHLHTDTKIMAVVKAEAYGSGSVQIAQFLENEKIEYLAVALLDEAIRIRQAKCKMPLMVFNVQDAYLDSLWEYDLEPEVYNIKLLRRIAQFASGIKKEIKVHLKIESGMNRLGFIPEDIVELKAILKSNKLIKVASIFSHLSASEARLHDEFTKSQFSEFEKVSLQIEQILGYSPIKHILNTAGILRFSEHQYNMVRLGIGMYGIDDNHFDTIELEKAHSLTARILQIKELSEGQTTGYNRSGKVNRPSKIAIISIGYADGFMRKAGNGNYSVRIHDQLYPTIGNICMDVSMIDITGSNDIVEGDPVIIFDNVHSIETLAKKCETISYEIISRIAPRVKRIYVYK